MIEPDKEPIGFGGTIGGPAELPILAPTGNEGSAGILGENADARHVSLALLTLLAVLYTLHSRRRSSFRSFWQSC